MKLLELFKMNLIKISDCIRSLFFQRVNKKNFEKIYIMSTSDMHCSYKNDNNKRSIGFEYISGTKEKLIKEGKNVLLVDVGDAICDEFIGAISNGKFMFNLLDKSNYDVLVPGNHEFDYDLSNFFEFTKNRPYISCNFVKDDINVLPKYKMFYIGGRNIAFIGVSTPHSLKCFKTNSEEGNYGFSSEKLYEIVQETVNEVKNKGADFVIVLSHLGNNSQSEPYTSKKLINSTNGVDAVIDAHSHEVIEKKFYTNKEGKEIILSQSGVKQVYVSLLTIDEEGVLDTRFFKKDELVLSNNIKNIIEDIDNIIIKEAKEVVGETKFPLVSVKKEGSLESKLVCNRETNLGDFVADFARYYINSDCVIMDTVGFNNNIEIGNITYENLFNLYNSYSSFLVIKVKGQIIKDLLEWAVSKYPSFDVRFVQVSGIAFEFKPYIKSSVIVDENEKFVKVNNIYRVDNIKINSEYIDLNKKYVLATTNYVIKYFGRGIKNGFEEIELLGNVSRVVFDFRNYININFNGCIPDKYKNINGEGRIKIKE